MGIGVNGDEMKPGGTGGLSMDDRDGRSAVHVFKLISYRFMVCLHSQMTGVFGSPICQTLHAEPPSIHTYIYINKTASLTISLLFPLPSSRSHSPCRFTRPYIPMHATARNRYDTK